MMFMCDDAKISTYAPPGIGRGLSYIKCWEDSMNAYGNIVWIGVGILVTVVLLVFLIAILENKAGLKRHSGKLSSAFALALLMIGVGFTFPKLAYVLYTSPGFYAAEHDGEGEASKTERAVYIYPQYYKRK